MHPSETIVENEYPNSNDAEMKNHTEKNKRRWFRFGSRDTGSLPTTSKVLVEEESYAEDILSNNSRTEIVHLVSDTDSVNVENPEYSSSQCNCFGKMFRFLKRKLFKKKDATKKAKRAKLNDQSQSAEDKSSGPTQQSSSKKHRHTQPIIVTPQSNQRQSSWQTDRNNFHTSSNHIIFPEIHHQPINQNTSSTRPKKRARNRRRNRKSTQNGLPATGFIGSQSISCLIPGTSNSVVKHTPTNDRSHKIDLHSNNWDQETLKKVLASLQNSFPIYSRSDIHAEKTDTENLIQTNECEKDSLDELFPPEIIRNPQLLKYFRNRYRLFSRYDEGIQMDAESWYSVTPEKISRDIAFRCQCDVAVDGFCGAGGNTIQLAFRCERVIAIDIDENKIKMAKHNAEIYGVADRIEFIVGDFFKIAPMLTADVVFLSPPWGGPDYKNTPDFSLSQILEPYGGEHLYNVAKQITDDIAYYLPRNINLTEVTRLGQGSYVKVDRHSLNKRQVALTAYFGELAKFWMEVENLRVT